MTAVRNLVDSDRITEANGRLQATYAAAAVLGRCSPVWCRPASARRPPSPSTRRASRSPPRAWG
ncbi:hypothetical protein NKG94_11785 [Micromonospora sp. M12]